MQRLFQAFHAALNQFFEALDFENLEKAFDTISQCQGTLFLTGVGKSGIICQKIAATLVSTGTRAFFLSPTGALHGDIGIVTNLDLFLIFSKSGESDELLSMLPYIRKKGAKIIAVVSNPASRLARLSDIYVHLPIVKEICPYDLAPTVSTAAQLIFGDCLAIHLMQKKAFSVSDFASNHPGGLLGRKITLKVSDLMLKEEQIPQCRPEDLLINILPELTGKRAGCILIANKERRLKGIFTDGDLRRAIHTKGDKALQCKMLELMTEAPKTSNPNQFAIHALRQMEEEKNREITVLPVLEEGKIVGLLRLHDIIQQGLT